VQASYVLDLAHDELVKGHDLAVDVRSQVTAIGVGVSRRLVLLLAGFGRLRMAECSPRLKCAHLEA
jgi:hypothetical protein